MANETNFISQHLPNVQNRLPISPTYFEKGMIGEIYYMKTENGKKVLKRYLILCLQPNWQQKLHSLSLEHLAPTQLTKLVRKFGLIASKRLAMQKKIDFPKMIVNSSSQQFYNAEIKKILTTTLNSSYRIFKIENIKTATVFDYKFPKDIVILPGLDDNLPKK